MVKTFRLPEFNFEVQIGKVARQADGAVWFRQGGTVVLATAVSAASKDFPGFLPLTIEYRELFSAAGKIPGGYYKREGKATDREVLTSRLIDRTVRPLFPANYFDQVQIVSNVYSVDKEHIPGTLGLLATSLALCISKIPFLGPVGIVEIGRFDGKWVFNPLYNDALKSDVRIIVAGDKEGVCMVEGSASEISEDEFVDVMFKAHDIIKRLVEWQEEIIKEVGVAKEAPSTTFDWATWQKRADEFLTEPLVQKMFIEDKVERNKYAKELSEEFLKKYDEEITQNKISVSMIEYVLEQARTLKLNEMIFTKQRRIDGRAFDQVRPISIDVGLLPFTHGSAMFTRGRTQALVSVTLGGGQDEQRIETIMDEDAANDGHFMLHYNFPPFSVGEVRPMRGPGRREVGHGHLAASAIRRVLPSKEAFPYTIRIVADMLESDGSTSMATVCGSTMALMQGGVPVTKMVSGVAMGLLKSLKNDFVVLTDISGFEDAFGLMDFKVAGTDNGITAIQMDVKYKGGLSRDIFVKALSQARQGRLHILGEMRKVMTAPNPELSDLVPKLVTFKINTDKIGAVIGTGGKVIREIIEKTKTTIDIESDGTVKIFGGPNADLEGAVNWVRTLSGQIEKGMIYEGKVRRHAEFGIFVELVPGLDGLVHVSNIPQANQRTFVNDYKTDSVVKVEVLDYDETNGRVRLRIIE